MLLICPVRPGDHNPELRYALRSWEANLIYPDGLELWTVGYQPEWLVADRHVSGNRYPSAPRAVFDNVLLGSAAAAEAGHREVIYMNDDFLCLDVSGPVLPVRRDESLRVHRSAFPASTDAWWPRSLSLTLLWLEERGFSDPQSFEVHRPLLADPAKMRDTLRQVDFEQDSLPQWRTLYGVYNEIAAHPVHDVKLLGPAHPTDRAFASGWISTSDGIWRHYQEPMAKRFQKPSRWEC
jgi:hypothetical protein